MNPFNEPKATAPVAEPFSDATISDGGGGIHINRLDGQNDTFTLPDGNTVIADANGDIFVK